MDTSTTMSILRNAISYVMENEETYNQKWINLYSTQHGVSSQDQQQWSQPEKDWKAIKAKVVADFSSGFVQTLKGR